MMRVLITGATGYIGTKLTVNFLNQGYEVWIIVRKSSDLTELGNLLSEDKILFVDNINLLYQQIDEIKPELLVNLMGKFQDNHDGKNIDDLLNSNFSTAVKIVDAAVSSGCAKIINTGSYWQNYNKEDYNPVCLYAALKEAFQQILKYYSEVKKCKIITLKLFDTYGEDDNRKKLLNTIRDCRSGDIVELSEALQNIYLCHIDDVLVAYSRSVHILKKKSEGFNEIYSVRGLEPILLKNIIERMIFLRGDDIIPKFGVKPMRPREIIDPSGIGTILPGWEPKISLDEGLKRLMHL